MRPSLIFLAFAGGVFLTLACWSLTFAAVNCGDMIKVKTTLSHDLVCTQSPALTVIGPTGHLNMNGHRVTCTDLNNAGIQLEGDHGALRNGVVTGCNSGVGLLGSGQHKVKFVRVIENIEGIVLESPGNYVAYNVAMKSNGSNGLLIRSSGNTLKYNFSFANDGNGFSLETGKGNQFHNNIADRNLGAGFNIQGDENEFAKNSAMHNGMESMSSGFRIFTGNANVVRGNTAKHNGGSGFAVLGELFGPLAERNLLTKNRAKKNGLAGIVLENFAENNTVTKNLAIGNGTFDLQDLNFECDMNEWKHNLFITADPKGCITYFR